jgi:sugar lactone lactonase YvrE
MRTANRLTAGLLLVGFVASRADGSVQLLFSDNFNTADTNNFDAAPLKGRRNGTLADTVFLRSARTQQSIQDLQLRMIRPSAGGGGRVRFQNTDGWYNWAANENGTAITSAGRLRVEFDWTATNTTTTAWVALSIGHSAVAAGEPSTRVNNAQTDYGILFRGNGGSQRFDNGTGTATASFTPSLASRHVTVDFAFGSFEDGTSVTGLALVDGVQIDSHVFTWDGNAGTLFMELESSETGMLIDNCSVSAVSNLATTCTLGYAACAEGPASGTDTVVLAVSQTSASWLASSDAAWLHLPAAAGTGSTNLVFTFDANSGATRTGTVTVAGQALRVVQAGAAYVAANPLTLLLSSLNTPSSVAVDTNGNVYVCDYGNAVVQKWNASGKTFATVIGSGLTHPYGVAVDAAGNLYVSDLGDATVKKWTAATGILTTLISSDLTYPTAVGVDTVGNVYVADYMANAIKKWSAATSNLTTLVDVTYPGSLTVEGTNAVIFAYANSDNNWRVGAWKLPSNEYVADIWTNIPSFNFWYPLIVAVSPLSGYLYAAEYGSGTLYWQQGNAAHHWTSNGSWTNFSVSASSISALAATGTDTLYFTDSGDLTLRKWTQTGMINSVVPTGTTSVLASPLVSSPHGIAVDSRGQVFFSCNGNDLVGKWTPDGTVTTLVSTGLSGPEGVALDPAGNLYVADAGDASVKRWNAASGTLTTQLVAGLSSPWAVAVDAATNLFIADTGDKSIKKCPAGTTNLATVISVPPDIPYGLGVDAAGNVYVLESYTEGNTLLQCRPGSTNLLTQFFDTTVLDSPHGIAVDGGGDVVIADTSRWENVRADGSVQAAFAANLATQGTPEWWLAKYGWTGSFSTWETKDTDGDGLTARQEYLADSDPTNAASTFAITSISNALPPSVFFNSSTGRLYTLLSTTNLVSGSWSAVSGAGPRLGVGDTDVFRDTNRPPANSFYKLKVELP